MLPVSKMWLNTCSREVFREIRRQIAETTTRSSSNGGWSRKSIKPYWHTRGKCLKLAQQDVRSLSTIQTKIKPASSQLYAKEDSREFMAVFPDIVRDLTDAGRHSDIPEVMKRFVKVLQHNVPNGKKSRGLSTVLAYKMLEKQENLTPENVRLANVLGWCVELLQAFFLVSDDIMDGSKMRRGQPTWHTLPDVGLQAINDAILMENSVYSVLRKYFSGHPCYVPSLEIFHDVTMKTSMGQMLDSLSVKNGRPDLDNFSMKRYNAIVKYKTAYYTLQLPVALAMYLAGMYDPEQHRQVKTILLEIGQFFQMQDDFIDCYRDPDAIGKIGTDIQNGKCSWLAVVALQRATPVQRQIMDEHYGKDNPESVQIIKNLYEELHIPSTFAKHKEKSIEIIRTHIQQISKGLQHDLFFKMLKMYTIVDMDPAS